MLTQSLLAGLALAITRISAAAPTQLQVPSCPLSIKAESVQLTNIEAGWKPFTNSPLYLNAAAPTYGPPEMRGDLVPDSSHSGKNQETYTYDLGGPYPEGKWLKCSYGYYDEITLSRRLPDEITSCTFVYRAGGKAGQKDIKITCK